MNRRELLKGLTATTVGSVLVGRAFSRPSPPRPERGPASIIDVEARPLPWNGAPRNVVVVRFGGGVRREETIGDGGRLLSPWLHEALIPNGTLYPDLFIPWGAGTGHMEGTIYLTTGTFAVEKQGLGIPEEGIRHATMFEAYRAATQTPRHQVVVINNEQLNTEFINYGDHPGLGRELGPTTLSLHGHELRRLRDLLAAGPKKGDLRRLQRRLDRLQGQDPRTDPDPYDDPIVEERFWRPFLQTFGQRVPKGDAFQTEATIHALRTLKPRLLMVNFQDCDYAHWGPRHFYDEGVRRMDQGLRRIVEEIQRNPHYRENTVVFVVPEVGRGTNLDQKGGSKHLRTDYQHHNPDDLGSHQTFLLAWGSGIRPGITIDEERAPIDLPATVGQMLGFSMSTDGKAFGEVLS